MTRDTAINAVVGERSRRRGRRLERPSSAVRRRRRSRPPLAFTFDGKPYLGFDGDSIASALARQRRQRRRPQLQVSPAARNLGRVDGGAERDRRRDARRRDDAEPARDDRGARERPRRALGQCGADGGRRSRRLLDRLSAVLAGGLLLQDFPLAALGDLRGRDPRHGRTRPRRSGQSPAGRQSAIQRALRSAGRRRGPGGSRRGQRRRAERDARCSSSTTMPRSAASWSIAAARSTAETGAIGRSASRARSKPPAGG